MSERVSIIVPVYNKAEYLQRTLKSILNQTHKNIEVIIIDDGSTDDSEKIIKEFSKKDDRIVSLLRENRGASKTRNQGLEMVKGEYVCFIDADDVISPNFIENLLTGIKNADADVCVIKDFRIGNNSKKSVKSKRVKKTKSFDKQAGLCRLFSGKDFGVGPCNKIYKTSLLNDGDKVRFPENIFYSEDVPFVLDVFLKANRVAFIKRKAYAYRRAKNSNVTSRLTKKKTTTLDGMDYCKERITASGLEKASVYVRGWRALVNFEIFYYMQRDKYFDESLVKRIFTAFSEDLSSLKKGKQFPLYRRLLLPLAIKLNLAVYNFKKKREKNKQKEKD